MTAATLNEDNVQLIKGLDHGFGIAMTVAYTLFCILMLATSSLWGENKDFSAAIERDIAFQSALTPEPTASPPLDGYEGVYEETKEPTASPTFVPTTLEPTKLQPTLEPTREPTLEPTTLETTQVPTTEPTLVP